MSSLVAATGKVDDIVDSKIVLKTNLYHVMGEYKSLSFRLWSKVNPGKENKKLLDAIKFPKEDTILTSRKLHKLRSD